MRFCALFVAVNQSCRKYRGYAQKEVGKLTDAAGCCNKQMKHILDQTDQNAHTGPMAKCTDQCRSSERSILMKAGINGTEKSRNIKINATAESIAVTLM